MNDTETRYLDTHCHLDLYKNVQEILQEAKRNKVLVLGVTNTPSVFPYTEGLSKQHTQVLPAIGLHPELALQRKHELPQLWEYLKRTRFVGEVGLDYVTTDQNERRVQREIFSQIVEQCSQYPNKILTIHSRRSASDIISIIGSKFPGKVILHWFSGSDKEADLAITNGYYFSFNPSMMQSKKGRLLAARIPKDRILTETDGPFVLIAGQPVRPYHVHLVVGALAEIYKTQTDEVRKQIWANYISMTEAIN